MDSKFGATRPKFLSCDCLDVAQTLPARSYGPWKFMQGSEDSVKKHN